MKSVALFLGVFASPLLLVGQSVDSAVIVGTVSDSTGAVLPGVTVLLTHVDTDTVYKAESDAAGYYRTPPLRIGAYVIEVEVQGFKKTTRRGVVLNVGDIRTVDIRLEVGQVTESVSIVAQAPLLDTTGGSAGAVVENKLVVELPLNGRDYLQLAKISPGVLDPGTANGAMGISVNGSQGTQVNFLIDGIDNNNQNLATQGGQKEALKPQIDAVQEFKVVTNSYSAEYGRSIGGVVILTTKSGTNEIHGTAFEFLRNETLDAKNYFTPPAAVKPPFKRNQYGFSAGGPVKKNRMFLFGDVQWTKIRQSQINVDSVPPPAWSQGNFSGFGATAIYDPATYNAATNMRAPFPGNSIPQSRMDRVTTRVLNWWPAPQVASAVNNYTWVVPVKEDDLNWDVRYDQILTAKDNYYFRLSRQDRSQPRVPTLPDSADGLMKQGQGSDTPSYQTAIVYNRVFKPNLVFSARAGWNMLNAEYITAMGVTNPIIGVNENNGLDTITPGSAVFQPSGFTGIGTEGGTGNSFAQVMSQTRQESVDFTWMGGQHTVKFGQTIFWLQSYILNPTGAVGGFSFDGRFTNQPATGAGGEPLADMLLGYSTGYGDENYRTARLRSPWFQEYIQDDWKVSDRLSLNLGLRYELNLPWVEKGDRLANFDVDTNPNSPSLVLAGAGGGGWASRAMQNINTKNLAPRFGFAYRVGESTVVRGGYGIYYANIMNTGGGQYMELNPPYHANISFTQNPVVPTFQVQDGLPPGNLNFANAPALSLSSFQRNGKSPMAQQWNITIQRQLPWGILWQMGYFGAKGNHLIEMYDLNYALPGPGSINPRRRWTTTLLPGTNIPLTLSSLNGFRYSANSLFHSLQVRAEKRFSNGLSFLASYMWSKNIGDAGWMTGEASGAGLTWGVQDPTNLRAERSLLQQDLRHNFVGSWVYELPVGRGKPWGADWQMLPNAALGGWSVTGIATLHTGFPMNMTVQGDPLNTGENDRPNVVGDWHLANPSPGEWFNTAAFVKNPQYQFGNAGRNILESPGLVDFDVAIFKSFQPLERLRVQFRAEAFNVFNTPQFSFPNTQVGNRAFGTITSAGLPRNLQFGLKLVF